MGSSVPYALQAEEAASALNATHATAAGSATQAENADTVDGQEAVSLTLPATALVLGPPADSQLIAAGYTPLCPVRADGAYAWVPTALAGAPSARYSHRAVWTGSEMVVWGGFEYGSGNTPLDTGARYCPATDTWMPITTTNAPSPRGGHTALWTGSEMIVWGGQDDLAQLASGGRYDPNRDTWTGMADAPEAYPLCSMVWTGSELIVWGGMGEPGDLASGGRYVPLWLYGRP